MKSFSFLIGLLLSASLCATDQAFFDKVEEITPNLYKISAEELRIIVDHTFADTPIITAEELKARMDSEKDVVVINVLPDYLFNDCHINGSINVPLKQLVGIVKEWDRAKKIVVYCALHECDAGEKACILLGRMGFEHIQDYKGGIKEWYQLGYPTNGPAKSNYLHMKSIQTLQDGYKLYPDALVCSRQTKWMHRYQQAQQQDIQ